MTSHQTRLNEILNAALVEYRVEHPDLEQDEARAALWDVLEDLAATVPELEGEE